jgi:spermidine dehydrogenase
MLLEEGYQVGYWFQGRGWVKDPRAAHFANTPWPAGVRRDIDDFVHNRRDRISGQAEPDRWLDSMTYRQLLDQLGYGPEVSRYIDPFVAVANYGVCGDAVSAFAAQRIGLPGTTPSGSAQRGADIDAVSFPGGNATILRTMLRRIIPDVIDGPGDPGGTSLGRLRFAALDRAGAPVRIRLGATAVDVGHLGDPASSEGVAVSYLKDGALRRVVAKAVVMAGGGWVNRRILRDLPDAQRAAYAKFNYGPVMTANVAVTNWRFLHRLGIGVARWFSGLGWHVVARRNIAFDGGRTPLTPDSPMMLTFYIPFLFPGQGDAAAQGSLARQTLLGTSYATFERLLRAQMTEMFGGAGFDARRDIAGIVLNRWGHAYLAPGPGFFFGTNGEPAPHEVIRRGYGRIAFGHSELMGNMNMGHAMLEGRRAGRAALELARV